MSPYPDTIYHKTSGNSNTGLQKMTRNMRQTRWETMQKQNTKKRAGVGYIDLPLKQ